EDEVVDPEDDFKDDQGKQADPRGGVKQPLHQVLQKLRNRQSYLEIASLAGEMAADAPGNMLFRGGRASVGASCRHRGQTPARGLLNRCLTPQRHARGRRRLPRGVSDTCGRQAPATAAAAARAPGARRVGSALLGLQRGQHLRSEEHTSELQSRENLVCRLLLEKKKENTTKP